MNRRLLISQLRANLEGRIDRAQKVLEGADDALYGNLHGRIDRAERLAREATTESGRDLEGRGGRFYREAARRQSLVNDLRGAIADLAEIDRKLPLIEDCPSRAALRRNAGRERVGFKSLRD